MAPVNFGNGRFMCGSGFRGKSDQTYLVDLAGTEVSTSRGRTPVDLAGRIQTAAFPSLRIRPWELVPDAMSHRLFRLDSQIYLPARRPASRMPADLPRERTVAPFTIALFPFPVDSDTLLDGSALPPAA